MKKYGSKHKVLLSVLFITIALLLLTYLGFVFYFSKHFFFHTKINGLDVSQKTTTQTEEMLAEQTKQYTLTLVGRDNLSATICAGDIQLTFAPSNEVADILAKQNPFLWFTSIFSHMDNELYHCISYNEEDLENYIASLPFFSKENIQPPKNAYIDYVKGDGYYIVNEQQGNKVLPSVLTEVIITALKSGNPIIFLEREDCYKKPDITSETPELLNLLEQVSVYDQATITYKFGKNTELVDSHRIHKWLKINSKHFKVKLKKKKIRAFVDYLSSTYNTYGRTRTFTASNGHKVSVSGGDYGWLLNRDKETKALLKAIKKGKTVTRKPAYLQKAASHGKTDWGNTYVEINLTAQHIWFYKKGKLIVESDFVSGNESRGWHTPQGVYDITYKQRDAILGVNSNADYRTPVSFWMPFNGNIGLHDATWRSRFGGTIYKTGGSHGCVNLPYTTAEQIFNHISTGDPVICYFDAQAEQTTSSSNSGTTSENQESTSSGNSDTTSENQESTSSGNSDTTSENQESTSSNNQELTEE